MSYFYQTFILQPGQIIDIRAMINDATKLNAEEGVDGQVGIILYNVWQYIETKVNNHNLQNTKGLDHHYQIRHTCTLLFIYLKKKRKKYE